MRTQTIKLLDMMYEGTISPTMVAEMAMAWMSEDDVAAMMRANDILDEETTEISVQALLKMQNDMADFDPNC
jgi:hypothetical protein